MFTIDELLDARIDSLDRKYEAINKEWEQAKANIIAGVDAEKNLIAYDRCQYDARELYEAKRDNKRAQVLRNAFTLFNKMSWELGRELKAETTDDKIIFQWNGYSLSFIIKMLAGVYELHSGMFGFDSGFTRHEVYTKDNYCFHIGVAKDHDDIVIINFGFKALMEAYQKDDRYAL